MKSIEYSYSAAVKTSMADEVKRLMPDLKKEVIRIVANHMNKGE